jgi:hypothetical protein
MPQCRSLHVLELFPKFAVKRLTQHNRWANILSFQSHQIGKGTATEPRREAAAVYHQSHEVSLLTTTLSIQEAHTAPLQQRLEQEVTLARETFWPIIKLLGLTGLIR